MPRIAFIVDDIFEDSEFQVPYDRVREAGHEAVIVGSSAGKEITGKNGTKITADTGTSDISADDFDAVVIPGGYSPDKVRTDEKAVALTRKFHDDGKPVAAICHAPWVLAEADVLRDKRVTSWPSLRTDLVNAGAEWVDEELVKDGNVITSRKPDDLPAFCDALLAELRAPAAVG
ncbi:type 1 glutamine amidotransferase [Actinobacteria bacterium YIM 96077]|uniref:Protease n=1 Tax=Phytoactinopolyspora halophila TaxID=1981511 RepID=A0A329QBG2_9ACTN|nr:type 1 glutamine amidotransferase domain-containing protein [Phytoactinopolyspora halophila]AYY12472.1 type 1 glutamine amidotransferase [Actinobacteria bacterium YIM 96077]RAW09331.1 protease [Phytoactinopolyspora halophila]